MGKNHRHKKNLKSEKSKTQLKKSKFLPKGQNVTNTEFKIKQIVVPLQLQSTSSGYGQRTLVLKEVVARLKHYNENHQIRACEDLEYLVKNCKEQFVANMCTVIPVLAKFIQTKLPRARRAGLNAINTLLLNFPEDEFALHFQYFSIQLRCAMTHIDRNVQEDSILFLDLFLTHVKSLIAKHAGKIFPYFLMLISRLRSDAELKRCVTVNLKSEFTSLGWRIMVLGRMYVFLEEIVSQRIANKIRPEVDIKKITYTAKELGIGIPIYKPRYDINNPYSHYVDHDISIEDEDTMVEQFPVLIPLLLETWAEREPVQTSSNEGTYISEETAMLLNCVIKILHLLWSYFNCAKEREEIENTIMSAEGETLIKRLVHNVPYCLINMPKKRKPNKFLNMFLATDEKCLQENLLICYLYLDLYCSNPSKTKVEDVGNIVKFITECLLRDYKNSNVDITYLIMILKHFLLDKPEVWIRNKVPVHQILENTITMYRTGNVKHATKVVLLNLLTDVEFEPLLRNETYESCLKGVHKLFLEPSIAEDVVDALFEMCRKNKVAFNEGYLNALPLIYGHLSDLEVTNSSDPEAVKVKIINMLTFTPPCKEIRQLLEPVIDNKSPHWSRVEFALTCRR